MFCVEYNFRFVKKNHIPICLMHLKMFFNLMANLYNKIIFQIIIIGFGYSVQTFFSLLVCALCQTLCQALKIQRWTTQSLVSRSSESNEGEKYIKSIARLHVHCDVIVQVHTKYYDRAKVTGKQKLGGIENANNLF